MTWVHDLSRYWSRACVVCNCIIVQMCRFWRNAWISLCVFFFLVSIATTGTSPRFRSRFLLVTILFSLQANLPYCIDIVSLCCMVLALSLIMDVVGKKCAVANGRSKEFLNYFLFLGACVGIEWNQSNSFPMLPILSGLHRNQLSTFLIVRNAQVTWKGPFVFTLSMQANLLIGALNLSIRTLILSPFWAIMCFLV